MFFDLQNVAERAVANDVFAAGIALGLFGILAGLLHVLVRAIAIYFFRRLSVTLTLDNRTAAFRHLMVWIDSSGALAHARRLQLTDVTAHNRELSAPAPGVHWFVRQGRLCQFARQLDGKARVQVGRNSRPMETVSITVFFGSLPLIQSWISEGAHVDRQRKRIGPALHVLRGDWWDNLGDIPARPMESVLCDDDRIERLTADVGRFYGARDWYAQRGVPWRRGYLLYGPPGTGKSSAIRAIASSVGRDLATLDIGRPGLGDDELREAMYCAPREALIVMEDIDAVYRQRDPKSGGVSFSGLLNAMDGLASQEGRTMFMTTNHRERLDPALIRPGRADMHVELGSVSSETARRLFLRFFPEEAELADRFQLAIGASRYTPAQLQGWLLQNAEDAVVASTASGLCDLESEQIAAE